MALLKASFAPDPAILDGVRDLYDQGRFIQALRLAESSGDVEQWTGTGPRILAGRLLRHVGAAETGERLILRAYRRDPGDPEARYFHLRRLLEARGPVTAWERFRRFGCPPSNAGRLSADWLQLGGRILSILRDFGRADEWFGRSTSGTDASPWSHVEWCEHLQRQDRYDEALESALAGLEQHPDYWGLELAVVQCQMLCGKEEEAIHRAGTHALSGECAYAAIQWATIASELQRHAQVSLALDRLEVLAPRAGKELRRWAQVQRTLAEYHQGRRASAAAQARLVDEPIYWTPFAERLETASDGVHRVELPVGFTRQHQMTCVPATLTTLSRFWGRPADHLSVAEAICYDGTPSHSERHWAETNGWVAREFRVTLEAARALLDRGVPFCLTTVSPANAHEQAVIGYDDLRRSLLIRDPWYRNRYDVEAEALLKGQVSSGPRGMAMVPADRGELLDGLELPEAGLYDEHHSILRALDTHDRPAAVAALERLAQAAPGHHLELQARRALAAYDSDTPALARALDALLKLFPDDVNLQLGRLGCMRELLPRADRLEWLWRTASGRQADPLVWQELAQELSLDARENPFARRCLLRARRQRGADPTAIHTWATLCWAEGDFEEALEHYRFAAFLADKREEYWQSYFCAAQGRGRSAEVVTLLTERFERLGRLSAQPARTLVWVLHQLDRTEEAAAVVRSAVALRPEDGQLALFAAEEAIRHRRFDEAQQWLSAADGRVIPVQRLRVAALLAERQQDAGQREAAWRRVLEADPLGLDAHRALAQLLAERSGRTTAVEHLREACKRLPHHVPLRSLLVEWLRDGSVEEYEKHVEALVAAEPTDAWAQRELSLARSRRGRHSDAIAFAALAIELSPSDPSGHGILAHAHLEAQQTSEAAAAARAAIRLSVDYTFAQNHLMAACGTLEERRAAIEFIRDELVRQTTGGTGLLHFLDLARPFLPATEILDVAEAAHAARPELWAAWLGLAQELRAIGRLGEALARATEAAARFPLVSRITVELATVHRARLEMEPCIAALERVQQIEPAWGWAMRELAEVLVNHGNPARALEVLESSVRHSPLDAQSWTMLGWARHRLGDVAGALTTFREAVRVEPGQENAWDALRALGAEARQPELAVELARQLCGERPAEARSWMVLARMIPESRTAERLEAIDRALALVPDSPGLWRQRVLILVQAGRFAEASASCRPESLGERPPTELRALAAVVRAKEGFRDEAIGIMVAVLAEDPSLAWGWRDLASWQLGAGQLDEASRSACRLEELEPGNAEPLAFRAAIALERGEKAAALDLLTRAHAIDAGYAWAGCRLVRLRVEARELEDAEEVLKRLRGVLSECEWLALAIEVELQRGGIPGLAGLVSRLMHSAGDEEGEFLRAAKLISEAGVAAKAVVSASEALRSTGKKNLSAGVFFVALNRHLRNFDLEPDLDLLVEGSESARRAWMAYLEFWIDEVGALPPNRHKGIRLRIEKRQLRLKADDGLWARSGALLRDAGFPRVAMDWLADWKQRPGLEPWQLFDVLRVALISGTEMECLELLELIVNHPRRDHATRISEYLHAFAMASRGQWDPARRLLAATQGVQLTVHEEFLDVPLRGLMDWIDGRSQGVSTVARSALTTLFQGYTKERYAHRWFTGATRTAARTGRGIGSVLALHLKLIEAWGYRPLGR